MSRVPTGEVVYVKPRTDVYTALVAIALLAELIAFAVMFSKSGEIFDVGKNLFS